MLFRMRYLISIKITLVTLNYLQIVMKLKEHKQLIANGAPAMIQSRSFYLRPSAEMFFGFLPNTSARDVMLRGRERFTECVERLFDNISLDRHQ
jgi:hypothetical protein